jgi:GATA-binding protein
MVPSPLHYTDDYSSPRSTFISEASTPQPVHEGKEVFFDHHPLDTSHRESHNFDHGRSRLSNSLVSPYEYITDHDSLSLVVTNNGQHSSNVPPGSFDVQLQHTHQWQMTPPEDTVRSLGSPVTPQDDASEIRDKFTVEGDYFGFGYNRPVTRTDSSRSPSEAYIGISGPEDESNQDDAFPGQFELQSSASYSNRNGKDCKHNITQIGSTSSPGHGQDDDTFDHPVQWKSPSPSDTPDSDSRSSSVAPDPPRVSSKKRPSTALKRAAEGDMGVPPTCTNCSTQNTPLWRKTLEGHPMCNACGLFFRLHGVDRPLSLKTDVIKKRKRRSVAVSAVVGRGTPTRATKAFGGAPQPPTQEE